jgi:hypothetical protein
MTYTAITSDRLEKLCRQVCEEMGLDPDATMVSKIDSISEIAMPRWQTFASKVSELYINKVIFDVLAKEADVAVSS